MSNTFHNNTIIEIPLHPPSLSLANTVSLDDRGAVQDLYKHCPSKFYPSTGKSLRLGTLSEYRVIENDAVRDEYEGLFNIDLVFDGTKQFEIDWLIRTSFGTWKPSMNDGSYFRNLSQRVLSTPRAVGVVYSTDDLTIERNYSGSIRPTGSIFLHYECADAYVFCMSENQETGSVIYDDSYDTFWKLPRTNLDKFCESVSRLLISHFQSDFKQEVDTIGPFQGAPFGLPSAFPRKLALSVVYSVQVVQYQDKKIQLCEQSQKVLDEVVSMIDRSDYIKEPRFSPEREVRVVFRPCLASDQEFFLFPNRLTPCLLPCENVLEYIS